MRVSDLSSKEFEKAPRGFWSWNKERRWFASWIRRNDRKFYITQGPESGGSGSPLFRKEKHGLVLIRIVAGKVVHQNSNGTIKDLQYGYAYSVDKVLKDIEASVNFAKEIINLATQPKVPRKPAQP
jgi:hypothetical protein